jgi:putative endonuclease
VDIAQKKQSAVIEVKTRSSLEFGLPQDFVKPKKYNFLPRQLTPMSIKKTLTSTVLILAIHKEGKSFVIEHLDAFITFNVFFIVIFVTNCFLFIFAYVLTQLQIQLL